MIGWLVFCLATKCFLFWMMLKFIWRFEEKWNWSFELWLCFFVVNAEIESKNSHCVRESFEWLAGGGDGWIFDSVFLIISHLPTTFNIWKQNQNRLSPSFLILVRLQNGRCGLFTLDDCIIYIHDISVNIFNVPVGFTNSNSDENDEKKPNCAQLVQISPWNWANTVNIVINHVWH